MTMNVPLARLILALGVAFAPLASAEEKVSPPASAPPAAENGIYSPTDLATLREQKGKSVTVEGTIANYSNNRADNIRYLNFTKH